jgi:hypothetical protein
MILYLHVKINGPTSHMDIYNYRAHLWDHFDTSPMSLGALVAEI